MKLFYSIILNMFFIFLYGQEDTLLLNKDSIKVILINSNTTSPKDSVLTFNYQVLGKGGDIKWYELVGIKQKDGLYLKDFNEQHPLIEFSSDNSIDKGFLWEIEMFLTPKELNRYHRRHLLDNENTKILSISAAQREKELAVYDITGHLGGTFGDMFIIKPDKDKSVYYWHKYKAYPFLGNYWFQLNRIDSITWGKAYKVYYYCVSCGSGINYACMEKKTPTQDYLEIGYCPKLGAIYSYDYIYSGVKITLQSINDLRVEEFIKTGQCIEPFCRLE